MIPGVPSDTWRSMASGPTEPRATAPTDPREALAEAERAFEAGDFATARSLAKPLVSSADAEVAKRATELSGRLALDPVQLGVLVTCTLFFVRVLLRYVF